MGFGDLKTDAGLKVLNEYLADKSYIEGYQPSQADVAVFDALSGQPKTEYEHALRWYNHIKSYNNKNSLPGKKKSVNEYGPAATQATAAEDDDDDIDLFGSDEDDEEAEKIKQERLAAYEAKKSKKPTVIAKSNIILEVKPWDDETDMKKMEELVRSIQVDGLLWGSSKLVPVGYGIKKLVISCVVEDDKIPSTFLMTSSLFACLRHHDGLGYEVAFWICVTMALSCFVYVLDGVSVSLVVVTTERSVPDTRHFKLAQQTDYNLSNPNMNATPVITSEVDVEPELMRYDADGASKRRLAGFI